MKWAASKQRQAGQPEAEQRQESDSFGGPPTGSAEPTCAGVTDLDRGLDEIAHTVVGLSEKFRAFNNRTHHMSRDLSGMSLELSDVTDDIAHIRDTTGMLQTSNARMEIEFEKLRNQVTRLVNAVENQMTG